MIHPFALGPWKRSFGRGSQNGDAFGAKLMRVGGLAKCPRAQAMPSGLARPVGQKSFIYHSVAGPLLALI